MSGLVQVSRSLTKVLSSEPMMGEGAASIEARDALLAATLALLVDLFEAKRITPTEYAWLRSVLLLFSAHDK